MGIESALLAQIATGVSAVSAVTGFIGGQQQASSARKQASYNATVEANRRSVEEQRQKRQLTLAQGTARARSGGSGATLNSFSDVLDDNQQQGLMDIALGAYDSQITQNRIRYEGSVASAQAKQNSYSSLLSGADGVATGIGNYNKAVKSASTLSGTSKLAGK